VRLQELPKKERTPSPGLLMYKMVTGLLPNSWGFAPRDS